MGSGNSKYGGTKGMGLLGNMTLMRWMWHEAASDNLDALKKIWSAMNRITRMVL